MNVLVTGGSRGIGRAIALRFARDGAARVAIGYLRNDDAAEATAEELRAAGAEPVLVRGNVTSERVLEQVAALGPLDVRRPQRRDGRRPAGARDHRQALGLDDERERAVAPVARAGRGAGDAGGLVDRRDLVARLAPRARELRPRRHLEGGARGARPLPRGRARAERDPRQRRLRGRRRDRRARPLPEPRGDARRPAPRTRPAASSSPTTSPARSRSSARPAPRWCAGTCSSSTAASRSSQAEQAEKPGGSEPRAGNAGGERDRGAPVRLEPRAERAEPAPRGLGREHLVAEHR